MTADTGGTAHGGRTSTDPSARASIPVQVSADGVTLVGDAYGDPADPPVVLLHGGGQTRHSWGATGAQLGAEGWYAIAFDLRGHGASDWSPDGLYTMDRFAGDVGSIARWLGRPPVLVGASLGGCASLAALGEHPDLGKALVLVDVSPFLQPGGTSRIHDFMSARPDGFASLEEVADAVAAYLPHRPRPRNLEGLRKNLREADGRLFWHWDPAFMRPPADEPVRRDAIVDPVRLGAAAVSLRVPTLLVRGAESDVLSEQDAARFLRLVPHAEYVDVQGAHHMVAGDDNAVFDKVVVEFLDRRLRPRMRLGV